MSYKFKLGQRVKRLGPTSANAKTGFGELAQKIPQITKEQNQK